MKRLLFLIPLVLAAQVPYERIVKNDPKDWLTVWGDYGGVRFRQLSQINSSNVQDLRVEWMYQTGLPSRWETTPLVADGVMYLTGPNSTGFAIDAKTGRELWRFAYPMPKDAKICQGTHNRGFAILGDRLYLETPHAHLLSLDARTGHLIWDVTLDSDKKCYGGQLAPLAVKDKILAGVSGGEFGVRGFIDAYDAITGKRLWRFWTIPAKGDPGGDTWNADSWKRGGGASWMTGTYDPQLKLTYWGIGNPGPDLNGNVRKGDNLYSCSVVALDVDSGKLRWHFQMSPHDTHDWDASEVPMLLDHDWNGQPRKLLLQANRNAFFYVLDRETGEFLDGKPYAKQTWAKALDPKGRPILNPNTEASPDGAQVCPGLAGAANWPAPSYNPKAGLFYFPTRIGCDVYYATPPQYVEGQAYWGSVSRGFTDLKEYGTIRALDPFNIQMKWDFKLDKAGWAGTLATSGDLLFAGDQDGYLMAFDAFSGKLLWKLGTGYELVTSPITFMIEGRQYVTIPSGAAVITLALPR